MLSDEFKITEDISVTGFFAFLHAWLEELTARIKAIVTWLDEHKPAEEDAEEEE